MTIRALLALTLAFASPLAQAEFLTGSDLLRRMEASERIDRGATQSGDFQDASFANGFLAGVHDVLVEVTFCGRAGVTLGQVRRIAHAYIRAVPHRHHEHAYLLVREALDASFQCAEQRRQPQQGRSL